MWVRKSDQEVARERDRLWLTFRGPIFWFIFTFLGIILAEIGPNAVAGGGPASTFFGACLFAAFIAMIAAIAGYVLQLFRILDPDLDFVRVVICDNCFRVKRLDAERKCECGGAFEALSRWKWVDDESELRTEPTIGREPDGSDSDKESNR